MRLILLFILLLPINHVFSQNEDPRLYREKQRSGDYYPFIKLSDSDKDSWEVVTYGGRNRTGLDVLEWTQQVMGYGAGEILLTSMDRDGTKEGFDNRLVSKVSSGISIPVIASGGVGNLDHLVEGIKIGGAEAVLAASIFHFSEFSIREAKDAMKSAGINIRF